jgi:protein-S-isoprenylcysteine O-methyltransferase Ste14
MRTTDMSGDRRKLNLREDWPVTPLFSLFFIGLAVSVYDFIVLQGLHIQLNPTSLVGAALVILGGSLRSVSKLTLKRAGFGLVNSARLRVIEKQRLVTDGIYRHIRHPLYLGEIMRNIGFTLVVSSLYGLIPMLLCSAMLLFRIGIEERMLVEEFGVEYEEYMRRTKKLIPYVY